MEALKAINAAGALEQKTAAAEVPQISVVVPNYKRPQLLQRFLQHHLVQLETIGMSFEIIVADDASSDETRELLHEWENGDERVRVIRHSHNIGLRSNFLFALRQARGKYAVCAGNDAILVPDNLAAHIRTLDQNQDAVLLQAPWLSLNESTGDISSSSYSVEEDRIFRRGEHGSCLEYMLDRNVFPEWFITRTSAMDDIFGPADRTAYHFFTHVAHALQHGAVVFAKEPFAIVTVGADKGVPVGSGDPLFGWDEYRGGLEYFASFVRRDAREWYRNKPDLLRRIDDFAVQRMRMALEIHVGQKNWLHAWHLNRRLAVHDAHLINLENQADFGMLAALLSCVNEASSQGFHRIVLLDAPYNIAVSNLSLDAGIELIRGSTVDLTTLGRCAVITQGPRQPVLDGERLYVDLNAAIRRYRPHEPLPLPLVSHNAEERSSRIAIRESHVLGAYSRIVFICPVYVTGGPEAIHQAAATFRASGANCTIAYYLQPSDIVVADGVGRTRAVDPNVCFKAYGHYEPQPITEWPANPDTLVIIPENITHLTSTLRPCSVGIWWLSVDNAFHTGAPLTDEATAARLFADQQIVHFHQSAYAREFLRSRGVANSLPLSDHTADLFLKHQACEPNRSGLVAYNPAKGLALAETFFSNNEEVKTVALRGMSPRQIVSVLRGVTIYIDFGHFPGKDRMPREAAASGAIILLHNRGSARFLEDFPIDDHYRFDAEDVASGRLRQVVDGIMADPDPHWRQQAFIRSSIRRERRQLAEQVACLLEG